MIPESLIDVPRDRQVRQTFGWHPLLIGLVLLGVAIYSAMSPAQTLQGETFVIFGFAALGVVLIFIEWNRRSTRTVLSGFPEGIAVYCKGKLDLTIQAEDITT